MNSRHNILKYLLALFIMPLLAMGVTSCSDDSGEDDPAVEPASRTVLVYMVANNSLGYDDRFIDENGLYCDEADMQEMLDGIKTGALGDGRLIVYHGRPHASSANPPQLLELTKTGITVLKDYTYSMEGESVTPERISEVMADMKSFAPALDYGLVLWSHANGWLGPLNGNDNKYRAFGEDEGYHITVQSLAKALEGEKFAFIYFDCCLMGNIETLYEMRDLAPYMVACPTELEIDGMPYDQNVPVMFDSSLTDSQKVVRMANNTYNDYFNASLNCQIAAYDISAIDDLAEATRNIFATVDSYNNRIPYIQRYSKPYETATLFDMDNYMELYTAGKGDDKEALLQAWRDAMSRFVIYSATTPRGIGGLTVNRYCGLGCFAIARSTDITYRGYNTLQWWRDVVSTAPLFTLP